VQHFEGTISLALRAVRMNVLPFANGKRFCQLQTILPTANDFANGKQALRVVNVLLLG